MNDCPHCCLNAGKSCSGINVADLYGINCFSNGVMQEKLPKNIYREIVAVQNSEKELTAEAADVVATAMRDWAIEKGASHYTHLFQPLTGLTAEKHDSFISPTADGKVIMEFSGKALIKGESDASSFPSGGLRATFEARGYTAWDVTSPAFLKTDPTGTTLCIPTAFVSYYGQALDEKVPLLKSIDALSAEALGILKLLGNKSSKRVFSSIGCEQEYFLVSRKYYEKRPDLMLTGRTVFGALPAKGQEMEDHYYGAIKEETAAFMRELNTELWKVGIPAKTQHNEVAPNQFEIVPVYSKSSNAVDANQFIMETLKDVARRHDMECLLHEKPFAGVNGSGKHINWTLDTDDGINLFDPGENPESNTRFLLFAAAVVEAVDRYALLLRSAAATCANDLRLGANEAPPAIVSIFFGGPLSEIFDNIADGRHCQGNLADGDSSINGSTGAQAEKSFPDGKMKIGATSLPSFPKDFSDRNRTSPFAFTGNKFEFRMIGSSQSAATLNTYLNTAIAQVLGEYSEKLERLLPEQDRIPEARIVNDAVLAVIKESYSRHRRAVFNGNGYNDEWCHEAKQRGLPNEKDAVEALTVLARDDTKALFTAHNILSPEEIESRYQIYLEKYSRQLNIEAGVTLDMAGRQIFPAVSSYASSLARDAISMNSINASGAPQEKRAKKIAELLNDLDGAISALETVLAEAQGIEEAYTQAKSYSQKVRPAMDNVRSITDALEKLCAKKTWPFPGYEELLFKL